MFQLILNKSFYSLQWCCNLFQGTSYGNRSFEYYLDEKQLTRWSDDDHKKLFDLLFKKFILRNLISIKLTALKFYSPIYKCFTIFETFLKFTKKMMRNQIKIMTRIFYSKYNQNRLQWGVVNHDLIPFFRRLPL